VQVVVVEVAQPPQRAEVAVREAELAEQPRPGLPEPEAAVAQAASRPQAVRWLAAQVPAARESAQQRMPEVPAARALALGAQSLASAQPGVPRVLPAEALQQLPFSA
jgi:hypothetical protein